MTSCRCYAIIFVHKYLDSTVELLVLNLLFEVYVAERLVMDILDGIYGSSVGQNIFWKFTDHCESGIINVSDFVFYVHTQKGMGPFPT